MKLRPYKGPSKGLYNLLYNFNNGNTHISNICHHRGDDYLELYSEVDFSTGTLVDISNYGYGVYTREQIVDFINLRTAYRSVNVTIKDIATEEIVTIEAFMGNA